MMLIQASFPPSSGAAISAHNRNDIHMAITNPAMAVGLPTGLEMVLDARLRFGVLRRDLGGSVQPSIESRSDHFEHLPHR